MLYNTEQTCADIPQVYQDLLLKAEEALNRAYAPYSNFFVGAALWTTDHQVIAAANVENAAYGGCICAERAAIVSAYAKGFRAFKAIAIIARGKNFETEAVTSPCGACRQMLYEVAQVGGLPLDVIMASARKDKIVISTIEYLLPFGFGPKDLGIALNGIGIDACSH